MRRYTARDERGIQDLAERLSYWVDIHRLCHSGDGTLILPLLHSRRGNRFGGEEASADPAGRLIVHGVLDVQISDDAQIGTYDIDELSYDPPRRTLTLRSGFPMELRIVVKAPYVRLELD